MVRNGAARSAGAAHHSRLNGTPICRGGLFGCASIQALLTTRWTASDADLAWNGITMGKKLADLAHAYDVLFAPAVTVRSIRWFRRTFRRRYQFWYRKLGVDDAPWRDDIMTHPLEIVDGTYCSTIAGAGCRLD